MKSRESPIAMAERHVSDGENRVERQRRLIELLERDRHFATADHARKILEVLQDSLRLARIHLEFERQHYGA